MDSPQRMIGKGCDASLNGFDPLSGQYAIERFYKACGREARDPWRVLELALKRDREGRRAGVTICYTYCVFSARVQ